MNEPNTIAEFPPETPYILQAVVGIHNGRLRNEWVRKAEGLALLIRDELANIAQAKVTIAAARKELVKLNDEMLNDAAKMDADRIMHETP